MVRRLLIALCVLLLPSLAAAQACVRVESPLYVAYVDTETKCCRRIDFTVYPEDLGPVGDKRRFYTPEMLADVLLEHEDYDDSGYDRGHLRALSLSCGSKHADDVNSMAVIVPMLPEVNRVHYRRVEQSISSASEWGPVCVSVVCDYDSCGLLPNADESHRVPNRISVSWVHPRSRVVTTKVFDNVPGGDE